MKQITLTIFLVFLLNEEIKCAFPNVYAKIKQENVIGDPGTPLVLTPLIEQRKIEKAQREAKVDSNIFLGVESFSGYLTVNKVYNSNMFFWFFPSQDNYELDPVLLWLQGGPGATSLYGLFEENGPFSINKNLELELRSHTWTKSHSVIYIDNPVGTGYSFTKGGYAQNETKVGEDLYEALVQFFTLFPELQKNEFYVAGESYAGKYVPAVCYTIHKRNPTASLQINLNGLSIGNGYTDPEHQLNYGDYLFQLGLIDSNTREIFRKNEEKAVNLIRNKEYGKAHKVIDALLGGDITRKQTLFENATSFDNYFNYLYPVEPSTGGSTSQFVQRRDIRAALHVGNSPFSAGGVEENLANDFMQSVSPWVSELLSNYRVLVYNGQLDIIVAYPLTVNYLQNLEFNGADEYKRASRYKWYVGTDLAGYVKQAGNLTEVLVRNAGHMVPADQPEWATDLITRFTRNKSFQGN